MGVGNGVTIVVDAQKRNFETFGDAAKGAKTVGDAAAIADKQLKDMGQKLDDANAKARRLADAEERSAAKTRDLAMQAGALRTELARSGDASGDLTRKIERLDMATRHAANANDDYRRSAGRAADQAREQARAYDRVAGNAREAARAVALLGASAVLSPNGAGGRGGGELNWLSAALGLGEGAIKSGGAALGAGNSAISAIGSAIGPAATPIKIGAGIGLGVGVGVPTALGGGAAIGGAVGLGIGAGAAGAGLAGAWMGDPEKYGALWAKAIDGIKKRWMDSSKAFGGELERDLAVVDQTLRQIPVEKILAVTHGLSEPLVAGAGGGIVAASEGIADALEHVQTIADQVGPSLASLGHDTGDAFRIMSGGAEEGGSALASFVDGAGYAIKITAGLVLALEEGYGAAQSFGQAMLDASPPLAAFLDYAGQFVKLDSSTMSYAKTIDHAAGATSSFASGMAETAANAARAAVGVTTLNDALTENRNLMMALGDANFAVAQGWLDLNEGLKDGAKTLDVTKQAGLDNVRVIEQQIGVLERRRQQAIETAGDDADAVAAANEAYEAGIDKLRKMAHEAGFTDAEVQKLIETYAGVPTEVKTEIKTPGMAESLNDGRSLGNVLNQIDRTYIATVRLNGLGQLLADAARARAALGAIGGAGQSQLPGLRTAGVSHAAAGGSQGGLTMVGEEGPEYRRLPTGTMMYPASNTAQGQTMAGWGGGGGGMVLVLELDGTAFGRIAVPSIADAMKSSYGGRPESLGIKIRS